MKKYIKPSITAISLLNENLILAGSPDLKSFGISNTSLDGGYDSDGKESEIDGFDFR